MSNWRESDSCSRCGLGIVETKPANRIKIKVTIKATSLTDTLRQTVFWKRVFHYKIEKHFFLSVGFKGEKFLKCDWLRPVVFQATLKHDSSVIPCSISNTNLRGFCRVSGINAGSWYFKTPKVLLAASDLEILRSGDIILKKHHSRYLSKIPPEIMPLLIQIIRCENGARFSIFSTFNRLCLKSALSAQILKYSARICVNSTLDQFLLKKITWYSLSVLPNDNRP